MKCEARIMLKIKLPKKANFIIDTLTTNGYEGYVVGGCVRDCIIGLEPTDWDITTSAEPLEVKALFEKTVDTGLQHGTVTVVVDGEGFEVTTYRIDGEYEDNRRPKEVFFTKNIVEDLKRRDFTINAMAYHPKEGLVDPFEGEADLGRKLIRCVGRAEERFDEDALRMLRAVRFSAKLGFDIHEDTWDAIKDKRDLIQYVSVERIREEMTKLLVSSHPTRFLYLQEVGLLQYIMPEFIPCFDTPQINPYHIYDVATHTMKTIEAIEAEVALRWCMLLHDIGKGYTRTTDIEGIDHFYGHDEVSLDLTKKIMQRLKFDNKTIRKVMSLVKHHDYRFKANATVVRLAMSIVGKEYFPDLLKVQLADATGQNPDMVSERIESLHQIKDIYAGILERNEAVDIKGLAIGGKQVMSLGYKGPMVGEVLEDLLQVVIKEPERNTEKELLQYLQRKI